MAKLLTQTITQKLMKNAALPDGKAKAALKPVVKVFGGSACTWLFTELDQDGNLFGLCDLGQGYPELGYVSLQELSAARFQFGLPAERDQWFKADKTLSEYADEARKAGRIVG